MHPSQCRNTLLQVKVRHSKFVGLLRVKAQKYIKQNVLLLATFVVVVKILFINKLHLIYSELKRNIWPFLKRNSQFDKIMCNLRKFGLFTIVKY